ncbi:signal peptidase I [Corynebacterium parakroppenstedtii]|uniref:signal peptidase I n=1 Tax=Corynebacterium parakroppenstedtii TaxID=2828363 RepID=UPI001F00C350|nr:signal peptidase I [Corynebacterium parakroppenstedtii]
MTETNPPGWRPRTSPERLRASRTSVDRSSSDGRRGRHQPSHTSVRQDSRRLRAQRHPRGSNRPQSYSARRRVAAPSKAERARKQSPRSERPWYIDVPIIIAIALIATIAFQAVVGRVYVIPSESMEPTLHGCTDCNNDRIFVNKMVYDFKDPKPGDVVVFKGPDSWDNAYTTSRSSNRIVRGFQNLGSYIGLVAPDENDLVKRVIATGGQTVECLPGDKGVKVNGKDIDNSYIMNPPSRSVDTKGGSIACGGEYFGPVKVPEDHLWVMGDNRTNSRDSRFHMGDQYQGTVPVDNVIGRVDARILPFNRIGTVKHPQTQS